MKRENVRMRYRMPFGKLVSGKLAFRKLESVGYEFWKKETKSGGMASS